MTTATGSTLATLDQLNQATTKVLSGIAPAGSVVRDDQFAAAKALAVDGRTTLVVQATGWGKSAVYWIATRALRDAGAGPTLVVSPLLSLMRNQVEAARSAGLRAHTLNSGNRDDWDLIYQQLADNEIDVLLTSPERLANPGFVSEVLPWLVPALGLLVIDESHCISSWGHDFRPDYRRISAMLSLREDLPVLATTATASARVTDDIAEQLGSDTLVLRGTLARESLHLSVVPELALVEAFAWVDSHLDELPGSGIVYAATVKSVTDLARFLVSRGHLVAPYHGQLDTDERERIESDLKANRLKAVIATSSLGMGYDKPDLGFVVHVGSPGSPVDYYQQVGRAGRALDTAQVVLIPTPSDESIWKYFAESSIPRSDEATAVLDALAEAGGPCSVPKLSAVTGVRDSRVDLLVKVLAIDGAVARTAAGWESTGQPWFYDSDRYAQLLRARSSESDLMRSYTRSSRCLESVLRGALDDPPSGDCGRCSVCTGVLPAGISTTPDSASVSAALAFLRARDFVLKPRALWGPNMTRSGRIDSAVSIDSGRALAFADDPAWPQAASLVNGPDAPCPQWVTEAAVAALSRWKDTWGPRPTLIVPVPSSRHSVLVSSLAATISQVGSIPVADVLSIAPGPANADISAKARAAVQDSRLSLLEGSQDVLAGQVVLLVDDTWRTGWTATIAGALLRDAGAASVRPFVIHQRP